MAVGLLLGTVSITSCQKQDAFNEEAATTETVALQSYTLNFGLSDQLGNKELLGARAIFKNLATGETHIVTANGDGTVTADLPQADYEVEISGYIPQLINGRTQNRRVSATQQLSPSFRSSEAQALTLTLSVNPLADFKIEEIYNAASGNGIRDQFFKITNTSNVQVNAAGLVIAEAGLLNTNNRVYTPEIRDTAFAAFALWRVPEGIDYNIYAGESIILANQAQNHTGGLDLTGADFEWYNPGATNDQDNPSVDDMEIIFSYTPNIWVIQQAGNRSYAIGYIPVDNATFLANYKYSPTYLNSAGNPTTVTNTYAFPNSWISDGVNIAPAASWIQNMLGSSIDAGKTGIDNTNYYGKSHQRKKVNGVLQDTNNSSNDFTYGGSTPTL